MSDDLLDGTVVSVDASGANVAVAGELLFCRVRGQFYEEPGAEKRPIAPGDRVRVAPSSPGEGSVEEIRPRRTKLSRRSGHRGEFEQVIAANVDHVGIVVAVRRPTAKPGLIDRMMVAARNQQLTPFLVVNKVDLDRSGVAGELRETYRGLGQEVFLTSAATGSGIEELRERITDRVTVFAGHSGVGKSSLLNAMEPGIDQKVGAVSYRSKKGRHTTTRAELLPLAGGGFVVDTPGIRAFGLWDLLPADLDIFFPEFQDRIEDCRFHNCSHSHEPGCAVREAAEAGDISMARFQAYLRIHATLEDDAW